jgi:hypothetical protein
VCVGVCVRLYVWVGAHEPTAIARQSKVPGRARCQAERGARQSKEVKCLTSSPARDWTRMIG